MLAPDLTRSDAVDFARHIPLNDEPAWEAAVDLVRGPFLDGFALPSSTEFDSWQSLMQQQVERHTLAALSRLVTAKTAAAARATLDPKQQQLPDEVDEVLGTTVATWDTNDENSAQSYLETAVQLAQQYGYL